MSNRDEQGWSKENEGRWLPGHRDLALGVWTLFSGHPGSPRRDLSRGITIRFVCEETTGEDWQARCSCGEINSENAEVAGNGVVAVEIQRNGVIHPANIS